MFSRCWNNLVGQLTSEPYLLIKTGRIFRSILLKQLARLVQQGSCCLWLVHLHNKLHCYRSWWGWGIEDGDAGDDDDDDNVSADLSVHESSPLGQTRHLVKLAHVPGQQQHIRFSTYWFLFASAHQQNLRIIKLQDLENAHTIIISSPFRKNFQQWKKLLENFRTCSPSPPVPASCPPG